VTKGSKPPTIVVAVIWGLFSCVAAGCCANPVSTAPTSVQPQDHPYTMRYYGGPKSPMWPTPPS
jgi:hypothetical protein